MVDEGSRTKPQLGTPFAGGIHDAEVILPSPEQILIFFTQVCNAAHQHLQLLILLPAKRLGYRAVSNTSQSLLGVRASCAEVPREQELQGAGPTLASSILSHSPGPPVFASPTSAGSYLIHRDLGLCS